MKAKIITLREVLDHIERGDTFSCICVAYDRQRRSGGHLIEIAEARIFQPRQVQGARTPTRMEELKFGISNPRSPRHGQHFTRNIELLQNGHPTNTIKKIHPPLITEFCGREVVL